MYGTERLGSTIKLSRKKKGYSQEKLAEIIGVTPMHIKHLESGRRLPSVEILFILSKELNFSIDSMIKSEHLLPTETDIICGLLEKCTLKELRLIEVITKTIIENR